MAESSSSEAIARRVKESGVEEEQREEEEEEEGGEFVRRWKYFLRDALRAIDPRDRLRSRGMISPLSLPRPSLFSLFFTHLARLPSLAARSHLEQRIIAANK